jgi:molybdate transport system substrate-binding protein
MRSLIWLCLGLLLVSCSSEDSKPLPTTATEPHKELLVFCGITMIDPVRDLMSQFEQANKVRMTMSYGGSSDLMQSIKLNKTGDIYFPGGDSFIAEADKEGLLKERQPVGVNQAALFVRKGNPKGLSGDLGQLLQPGLQVGIGHPDLGSIGKEAKRILDAKGIYTQVVAASAMLQPDSKALCGVLKEGKVDVVLNWKAVLHFQDNAEHMEMLPILGGYATPHKLTMAVVSFSREPKLANRFLEFCASGQGRAVFARYGF